MLKSTKPIIVFFIIIILILSPVAYYVLNKKGNTGTGTNTNANLKASNALVISNNLIREKLGESCFSSYFQTFNSSVQINKQNGNIRIFYYVNNLEMPSGWMVFILNSNDEITSIVDPSGNYSLSSSDSLFESYKEKCFSPEVDKNKAVNIMKDSVNDRIDAIYFAFEKGEYEPFKAINFSGYIWVGTYDGRNITSLSNSSQTTKYSKLIVIDADNGDIVCKYATNQSYCEK